MTRSEGFWIGLAMAVLAIVFVAAALIDSSARSECAERGGRYVTTSCSTIYITQQVSCGKNCWTSVTTPVESCSHECVIPVHEAPRVWAAPEYEPCPDDPLTDCSNQGSDRR